jgi:hypothetical protein
LYRYPRAQDYFEKSIEIIQPMIDQVASNFVVAATAVYLGIYLLYNNEVERATYFFSNTLDFVRSGFHFFQNQSFKNWIRGGFLVIVLFVSGLTLLDNSRDFTRLVKSIMYAWRVHQLLVASFMPLNEVTKNTDFEISTIMDVLLNDLITLSDDYRIDLEMLDDMVHDVEILRK